MTDHDALVRELHRLESSLLEPEVRTSRERLDALLADDFLEFGSSGRIWRRDDVLSDLPEQALQRYHVTHFEVRELAPDVALSTFRVVRTPQSGAPTQRSLRVSIWQKQAAGWRMIFHQGTPVPETAVDSDSLA
jgi:hypothetical protein